MARTIYCYGVSSKYSFGTWKHSVYKFGNKVSAYNWVNTEEADIINRALMTKTKAINLVGKKAVLNAEQI